MNETKVTMLRAEIDSGAYDPHGLKLLLAGELILDQIANESRHQARQAEAIRVLRDVADMRGDLQRPDPYEPR